MWAAPLLEGDVLYVASVNGKLFALNAATGEQKWDRPFSTGHGLISDPVLSGSTLLIGGIDRTLHAVDTETGEEIWSFKTDNWFWGRPLVDGRHGVRPQPGRPPLRPQPEGRQRRLGRPV